MSKFLEDCLRKKDVKKTIICAFCPLIIESTFEARHHVSIEHDILIKNFKKGARKKFKNLKDQNVLKEEPFSIVLQCLVCSVETRTNTGYEAHLLHSVLAQ